MNQYFVNYYQQYSDITVDLKNNSVEIHKTRNEPWKVTMLYTGQDTMTGGRIKRAREYVGNEPFMLTYGDGVSDVDIGKLVAFHKSHGKLATLTAVHPVGRFGVLGMNGDCISSFGEKTESKTDWINGGYMVLDPKVIDYIEGDETTFEKEPLERLSSEGQLMAYKHGGFWQCMDTMRDKEKLEELWARGEAKWKVW